jgi:hypothetical protein
MISCWIGRLNQAMIAPRGAQSLQPLAVMLGCEMRTRRSGARVLARCLRALACGLGAVVAGAAAPANAVTVFQKSVYSTLDFKLCTVLKSTPDGMTYQCPGLPGVPLYFAEGDDRVFLSAGPMLDKATAASQTLKAFNTPFRAAASRATIEWRFVIRDKRKAPYAMIVRYFTQSDAAKGQVLVVSKVSDTDTCHMAYIDALANADAIVLARRIADERAASFKCGTPPLVEGVRGKSPL